MSIMDKLKSALFVQKEQSAPAAPAMSYAEQEARYKENRVNAFREELAKLRPIQIQLTLKLKNLILVICTYKK